MPIDALSEGSIHQVAKTSISSKVLSTHADHFAGIIVSAVKSVRSVNELGDVAYPRRAVGIVKQHGRSAGESQLIRGFVLPMGRACQGMPAHVAQAAVALVDFDLRAVKMALGVTVTLTDPTRIAEIKRKELDITRDPHR